ncbi:MAG: glycosyltransferase family 2 protein [Elusimicrobiota bacterium]
MIVPSSVEMLSACLAVGTAQLLITLRFFFRARPRPAKPFRDPPARVSVIVPCKGSPENLESNINSILEQDYPGEAEYIFVVPSRGDPAFKKLEAILSRPGPRRSVLISSGASASACSEKILNILYGCEHVSENSEVLLFADCDLTVPRDWLTGMVRPLENPDVIVTTAHTLPAPAPDDLWGHLMQAWVSGGVIYMELMNIISGNSLAISRKDFALLNVPRAWRTSLCEDLTLTRLVRRSGRKVYFVSRAIPRSMDSWDRRRFFLILNRWTLYFRFYAKAVWLPGVLLTFFKFYAVWWALQRAEFVPVTALFLADIANLSLISRAFKSCWRGDTGNQARLSIRGILRAAIYYPLLAVSLQLVYAINFIASLCRREVVWGGYRYLIHSADHIEAKPLS